MSFEERTEFRGDMFRSDLDQALGNLGERVPISRIHPDTISVFFMTDNEVEEGLRLRGYGQAPNIVGRLGDITVSEFHLENKSGFNKSRLDSLSLASPMEHEGRLHVPHAVRVARRDHYYLDQEGDEARRITIDYRRRVFALDAAIDQGVRYLGDLGPRIEVKSPSAAEVGHHVMALGLDDTSYTVHGRSMELLWGDRLKRVIAPMSYIGLPEVEKKYTVRRGSVAQWPDLISTFVDTNDALIPLFPAGHQWTRLRRYHLGFDDEGKPITVVETTAGRLSLKRKANPKLLPNGMLLRDTVACHDTDIKGDAREMPEFLAANGIVAATYFTKIQQKQPFYDESTGMAFHLSYDECWPSGPHERDLKQVEMEFIGSVGGRASMPDLVQTMGRVASEFETWINTKAWGDLEPTSVSKMEHFLGAA
jgi:hypothetical protein